MSSKYFLLQGLLGIDAAPSSADTIRVYGVKRPNVLAEVSITAGTISFTRNASAVDTIDDSGDGLVTAGFKAGDVVRVVGGNNDGLIGRLGTVAAGTLSLHKNDRVTTEAAGTSITISTVSPFEEEYQDVIMSLAASRLARKYGLKRAKSIRVGYNEDLSQVIADVPQTEGTLRLGYRRL